MRDVGERLAALEARNQSVEADKAWETSLARRIVIATITYVFAALLLLYLKADQPYVAALIPTVGFYLSTVTLPFLKRVWVRYFA